MLPAEERDNIRQELEELLLKEFDQDYADRLQLEIKLDNDAKVELKRLEKQLSRPSQIQYYSGT